MALCNFPGCTTQSETTFALLPLCTAHEGAVRSETIKFYYKSTGNGGLGTSEHKYRRLYSQIDSQISWSKKRMGTLL